MTNWKFETDSYYQLDQLRFILQWSPSNKTTNDTCRHWSYWRKSLINESHLHWKMYFFGTETNGLDSKSALNYKWSLQWNFTVIFISEWKQRQVEVLKTIAWWPYELSKLICTYHFWRWFLGCLLIKGKIVIVWNIFIQIYMI